MYEGDWVNDEYEGKGKIFWENGLNYAGEFKKGFMNGKGTLSDKDNNIKYKGDFVND